jgi:hypothetical protein
MFCSRYLGSRLGRMICDIEVLILIDKLVQEESGQLGCNMHSLRKLTELPLYQLQLSLFPIVL